MTQKVGGIEFDINVSADGVITSTTVVSRSANEMEKAFKQVDTATKNTTSQFSALGANTEQLSAAFSKSSSNLSDVISRHISLGHTIDENNRVIDKNGNEITSATAALKKYADQANMLDERLVKSQDAFNRLTTTTTAARGSFVNLRHAAGQLGFQLQDIAVQAQMGTNAFVILGQQGSQIASIFGPTGAIVGGVLAVGAAIASVMVPSMTDGSDATEELSNKLKELSKTNELTINQQKFLKQVEAEETEEKKKKIAELEKEIAKQEKLAKSLDESARSYGRMAKASRIRIDNGSLEEMRNTVERLRAEIDTLNEDFGAAKIDPAESEAVFETFSKRFEYIQQSLNMEGDVLAAANARQFAIMQEGGNQQLALLEEQLAAQRARKQFEKERDLAGFEEERVGILENEKLTAEQKALLVEELNELEKQRKEQHQNELTNIEQDAAEKRKKIAELEAQAKLSTLSSIFGNLSSLMNTESRKLFEIGKVSAIAGAIVDTYAAANKALKELPTPLNYAAAAAVAVRGFANVRQIQATKFGSSGAGQSYQGGQVVNNTQQQPQQVTQRNISISLAGSGSFTGGDIRGLINSINEELGDGATLSIAGG